jgi:hypothetical protein
MYMQKMETDKVEGLSLRELESHARAELLPDRIEMHRPKRVRKKIRKRIGNVTCEGTTVTCNRIS